MEDIFKGESITVVLRCRNQAGEAVDMAGKQVQVLMADRNSAPVFEFSTDENAPRRITAEGNYLLCPLTYRDMSRIQGVYLVEIRVCDEDSVQIAQLPGVRVLDSITGNRF